MCQLKSCLVLKDRVFCPDYNSHQSMLEELGIKDDYLHASKTFVRVEFTPPDNTKSLIEPLDKWTLKVDQDVTPEWWDAEADRQRVEEAVEAWRREHVFTEGDHIVKAGKVYAYGSATVTAYHSATVEAYGSATVKACGNATVKAYGSATVKACGNATVKACDSATVDAYHSATVKAWGSATVDAYHSATVKAWGSATVKAWDSARVEAWGSATVKAWGSTTVKAYDSATVEAYDSVVAIYPEERKIIYPTGWTAETHE